MLDQEVRKIIYLAEEIANIPFGSIKSKSRKRDIVLARHCVGAMLVSGLGIHKQKASELMQRDRTSFNVYQKSMKNIWKIQKYILTTICFMINYYKHILIMKHY